MQLFSRGRGPSQSSHSFACKQAKRDIFASRKVGFLFPASLTLLGWRRSHTVIFMKVFAKLFSKSGKVFAQPFSKNFPATQKTQKLFFMKVLCLLSFKKVGQESRSCSAIFIMIAHSMRFLNSSQPGLYIPRMLPVA